MQRGTALQILPISRLAIVQFIVMILTCCLSLSFQWSLFSFSRLIYCLHLDVGKYFATLQRKFLDHGFMGFSVKTITFASQFLYSCFYWFDVFPLWFTVKKNSWCSIRQASASWTWKRLLIKLVESTSFPIDFLWYLKRHIFYWLWSIYVEILELCISFSYSCNLHLHFKNLLFMLKLNQLSHKFGSALGVFIN
jgi:hypothetical protein